MMEFKTMYFMNNEDVREVKSRFVFDGHNYFDTEEEVEYTYEEMRENSWFNNEDEAWKAYEEFQSTIELYDEE